MNGLIHRAKVYKLKSDGVRQRHDETPELDEWECHVQPRGAARVALATGRFDTHRAFGPPYSLDIGDKLEVRVARNGCEYGVFRVTEVNRYDGEGGRHHLQVSLSTKV